MKLFCFLSSLLFFYSVMAEATPLVSERTFITSFVHLPGDPNVLTYNYSSSGDACFFLEYYIYNPDSKNLSNIYPELIVQDFTLPGSTNSNGWGSSVNTAFVEFYSSPTVTFSVRFPSNFIIVAYLFSTPIDWINGPCLGSDAGAAWSTPIINTVTNPDGSIGYQVYLGANNPTGVPNTPGGGSGGDDSGGGSGGDDSGGGSGGDDSGGGSGGDDSGGGSGGDQVGQEIEVPSAPEIGNPDLPIGDFRGLIRSTSEISVEIPGQTEYPEIKFPVPIPGRSNFKVNFFGAMENPVVFNSYETFRMGFKAFCIVAISFVFFRSTFKLFRKNS